MDRLERGALIGLAIMLSWYFIATQYESLSSSTAPVTHARTAESTPRPSTLTRQEAIADLLDWKRRLLAVHPHPTHRISAEELDEAIDLAVQHIPEQIDRATFFVLAAGVASRLRDSHTAIAPPAGLASTDLPLVVEDDALCFTESVGEIPAGACLQALGVHDASAVLGWCRRLVSAETHAGLDRGVPWVLPVLLRSFGYGNVLPARVTTPAGTLEVTLPMSERAPDPRAPVVVHELPGNIVHLDVRTFVSSRREELIAAFAQAFAQMSRRSPRGLIIDLRDNDGGSTELAKLLLGYVTDRPLRMSSQKYWKVSRLMQEHLRDLGHPDDSYLELPPGETIVIRIEPSASTPPVHRFEGPTAFLIGPGTMSAAMMMADAVREYDVGLLVGEPTSSPPTYFGEAYTYRMPHSGLLAMISSAAFLRTSEDPTQVDPVRPHVVVETRLGNRLEGRDEPLDVALRLLETRAGAQGARRDAPRAAPAGSARATRPPSPPGIPARIAGH